MNHAIQHHYKRLRQHQMDVYLSGGGTITTYPGGKVELSYASAPYGEHALAAFIGAKAHIAFIERLGEYVKPRKKRGKK